MRESVIVAAIQRYLKRTYGPRCWMLKTHGSPYQRSGVPDLLVCIDGRFYAFEVKRPGEEPTALQRYEMAKLTDARATTAVVTSQHDVADVLAQAVH